MARLNSPNYADDAEREALLPNHNNNHHATATKPSKSNTTTLPSRTTRLRTFLNTPIHKPRADLPLIASFFVSGMVDAGAYNAYSCFTSMQTGNTVFAALGVADLPVASPRLAWTKSLTSILAFLLGSLALTALHRALGPTKRATLALSYLLQALLIAAAATLVRLEKVSGSPVGGHHLLTAMIPADPGFPWADLAPIALLSFQAAGKVVASRVTGQTGLPVIVLTTLYNDLIADPALFTAGLAGNVGRNRKVGGLVMYFLGATAGGWAARSPLGFSGGLAVGCAIQVLLAVAWGVWFEEVEGEGEEG